MSELNLAEGIYVKKSKSKLGIGSTAKERVMETFWYPCGTDNSYVELFPVTDDLQRVLMLKEKVHMDLFNQEYSLRDNSREVYFELKKMLP